MNARSGRFSAFTIAELLVVIAVIVLLLALLFPAVNAIRATARRSICMSNLRQIVMAVINHEAARREFPPAARFVTDPADPDADGLGHSMYSFLLPYFEEKAVYDELQFHLDWLDKDTPNDKGHTNFELTHTIHLGGVLRCPAAPAIRRHKYPSGNVIDESNAINQTADYAPSYYLDARLTASELSAPSKRLRNAGVLDIEPLWALVPDTISDTVRGTPSRATDDPQDQNPRWWGILRIQDPDQKSSVRAASVRDGLSSTFLLFEAAGRPDHFADDRPVNPAIMGTNTQGMRWGSPDLALKLNEACHGGQLIKCHNWDEVYAFHSGGAMVGFADGAVQLMRYDVDPELFVSLYTMIGQEVVNESAR